MKEVRFDNVPFEPSDRFKVNVKEYDGTVYIVTDKNAIGLDPDDATKFGLEMMEANGYNE